MTRQMVNATSPLGADALLKPVMVHALSALRAQRDLVLNALDVFVKEPLYEMMKMGKKAAAQVPNTEQTSSNWFPMKKLAIVRKKLDGYNPVHILEEELKETTHLNPKQPNLAKGILLAVRGSAPHIRARITDRTANVQEQVECLFDHATDGAILGYAWSGWNPVT